MEEAMEVAGSPKSQELSLEVHESGCEGGGLRSSKALVIMVCQKRGSLEGGDVAVGGSPSEAIWIPPPPNRIKCNVDAAVYGDGADDIEHPRVHPDMPPNVPPSDTVHNDISVNNNRDMSMPAEHSPTHTSNSEHTSVAQPRRSTRIRQPSSRLKSKAYSLQIVVVFSSQRSESALLEVGGRLTVLWCVFKFFCVLISDHGFGDGALALCINLSFDILAFEVGFESFSVISFSPDEIPSRDASGREIYYYLLPKYITMEVDWLLFLFAK
nr:hypothetical protein Iba_chr09dCG14960 [Ipomoea batatas]